MERPEPALSHQGGVRRSYGLGTGEMSDQTVCQVRENGPSGPRAGSFPGQIAGPGGGAVFHAPSPRSIRFSGSIGGR